MNKYNVLYIHTHDTGRYIDPYGYAIGTDNLMDFAKSGITFRDCHDGAPTCSPARACLLTGTHAHQNGQLGLVNRGINLAQTHWHMAQFFNNLGYDTVLAGIQHEHRDYKELGYRTAIFNTEKEDYFRQGDDINTNRAVDYILKAKEPYFLSIGYIETHREFLPSKVDENYVKVPDPIVDNAKNRKDFAEYMTSARHMDSMVGKVLDALDRSGQRDNTIVFFTTDHGLAMPGMKCNLYSGGTGVSLILRHPGMKRRGVATDSLCSHLDVFPTICDILDVEEPEWLMGVSQLPVIDGKTDSVREELFAEVNHHTQLEPMRCIRTKKWLYIKSLLPRISMTNCDASDPKNILLADGYYKDTRPTIELYNLIRDPNEKNNIVNDPKYRDVVANLDARLNNWMEETNDPFIDGEIHLPFTTVSNCEGEVEPGGRTYCIGDPSIQGDNQSDVLKRAYAAYDKLIKGE